MAPTKKRIAASVREKMALSHKILAVPAARYLTVQDAAAYLSTTVWAIRQLISERKIPHVKVGKRFVLDVQDLDNYFERQKVKAAA